MSDERSPDSPDSSPPRSVPRLALAPRPVSPADGDGPLRSMSSAACDPLRDLRIDSLPLDSLTLRRANPRTHSKKQIGQIADSIREFGFTNPS